MAGAPRCSMRTFWLNFAASARKSLMLNDARIFPLASFALPLASTGLPLASFARPLASTGLPHASFARPLVSTRRPLASTRRPLASFALPLASFRQLLASFRLPLVSMGRPLVSVGRPRGADGAPHLSAPAGGGAGWAAVLRRARGSRCRSAMHGSRRWWRRRASMSFPISRHRRCFARGACRG
jgi:hypothetical protein